MKTKNTKYLRNEELPNSYLTVIDIDGKMLGQIPKAKAIEMAQEEGMDLILVAPGANPPVCKIGDYGKFIYEAEKKEKERRKNQKGKEAKELRISPNIGENDLEIKRKAAMKFLEQGYRVKVVMRFRGREIAFANRYKDILTTFAQNCGIPKGMTAPVTQEGRTLFILL